MQLDLLKEATNEGAHLRVTRTYERIHEKYYWPSCVKDVARYCESCESCQMKKQLKKLPSGFLGSVPVSGPPYITGMDYIGPL